MTNRMAFELWWFKNTNAKHRSLDYDVACKMWDASAANTQSIISAAIDMYEAIKYTIDMDAKEGYGIHPDSIERMLKAIAKAEGRTE